MTPVTRRNMDIEEAIDALESYYRRIPEMLMEMKQELSKPDYEKLFMKLRYERRMIKAKLDDLNLDYVVSLRIAKMLRNRMEFDVNCC